MIQKCLALSLAIILALVVGCSSQEDVKEVDVPKVAEQIVNRLDFKGNLMLADGDVASSNYPGITGNVAEHAIYIDASGGTAEEVAVMRAAEGIDGSELLSLAENRVAELKLRFENYNPEQMVKLSDPVIEQKGDIVVLVICDDPAGAETIVGELLGS